MIGICIRVIDPFIERLIADDLCADRRLLLEKIRAHGSGGRYEMGSSRKAYFNAYRVGHTLKILAHELLPVPPW